MEDVSPLGGFHSVHLRRVRNSDFVRIHTLAGWCQIPKEVAVVPSECKATWKALPVGCLMYSVLPFGKRQRKMVLWWLSSQNMQGRPDSACCFCVEDGVKGNQCGKAACHGVSHIWSRNCNASYFSHIYLLMQVTEVLQDLGEWFQRK